MTVRVRKIDSHGSTIRNIENKLNIPEFYGVLLQLVSNSNTHISWDNSKYDTNNFWNALYPSRITIPSGVSKVTLSANINCKNKNSIKIIRNGMSQCGLPSQSGNLMNLSSSVISVTEGDYFELITNKEGTILKEETWFSLQVIETDGLIASSNAGQIKIVSHTVNKLKKVSNIPLFSPEMQKDDLLVCFFNSTGKVKHSPPDSTWDKIYSVSTNKITGSAYYKVINDSEPNYYNFSINEPQSVIGSLVSFRGADNSNPINVFKSFRGIKNNPITFPSVIPTINNGLMLSIAHLSYGNIGEFISPSGMQKLYHESISIHDGLLNIVSYEYLDGNTNLPTNDRYGSYEYIGAEWMGYTVVISPKPF